MKITKVQKERDYFLLDPSKKDVPLRLEGRFLKLPPGTKPKVQVAATWDELRGRVVVHRMVNRSSRRISGRNAGLSSRGVPKGHRNLDGYQREINWDQVKKILKDLLGGDYNGLSVCTIFASHAPVVQEDGSLEFPPETTFELADFQQRSVALTLASEINPMFAEIEFTVEIYCGLTEEEKTIEFNKLNGGKPVTGELKKANDQTLEAAQQNVVEILGVTPEKPTKYVADYIAFQSSVSTFPGISQYSVKVALDKADKLGMHSLDSVTDAVGLETFLRPVLREFGSLGRIETQLIVFTYKRLIDKIIRDGRLNQMSMDDLAELAEAMPWFGNDLVRKACERHPSLEEAKADGILHPSVARAIGSPNGKNLGEDWVIRIVDAVISDDVIDSVLSREEGLVA